MIVRTLADLKTGGNIVHADGWESRRYLVKKDKVGFSFHETIIRKGAKLHMWYKNHIEAVLCVKGHGTLTDLKTHEAHPIAPGTLYALNQHDRHILEGITEMTMICVFNPPLKGHEIHNEDGSYD